MGRAGAGSSGGHRSSGGGHSSSRSSGGHRVSSSASSRRAGSSSRPSGAGGYGGHFGGPGMPPPMHRGPGMPPPPRRRHYVYRSGGGYGGSGGFAVTLFVVIVWLAIIMVFLGAVRGTSGTYSHNTVTSTVVREKLDTHNAYINDCIIDELGWFTNTAKTASGLKEFWEETGIQPYIILKAYDAALITDAQKEQWTTDYYDANFDTENIFLYVYFAEQDADNDIGYMTYANGYQTSSVMDAEAVDIFWSYIDKYWYTDAETDDVFVNAFNDTAKAIMHVSTTKNDIVKWILILLVVIVIGAVLVTVIRQRNKRAREKAQEDAEILNTPINDIASDNLEDKYLDKE